MKAKAQAQQGCFRGALLIAAVCMSSGCSTIVRDKSDTIGVQTPGCPAGTSCTFSNKKGSWIVQTPGTLTIPKSDDTLHVVCRTPDGRQQNAQIQSDFGGMFWGNIIFGGGIGMIADAHTDAHRNYQESLVVPLCQ